MSEKEEYKDSERMGHVHHSQLSDQALKNLVREAVIHADRSRWVLLSTVLLVMLVGLGLAYINLTGRVENTLNVAWVKMYKNGTWDIEIHDSDRDLELLPAMVDSILTDFVERRFSERKETIKFDYGYANQFMITELSNDFVSAEGFNAPQKAVDVTTCGSCPRVDYQVQIIDHFDSDKDGEGMSSETNYRTNVFVDRKVNGEVDKRIIRIDWRLMKQAQIKVRARLEGGKEWLRYNPIGLEVLHYEEINDESDN